MKKKASLLAFFIILLLYACNNANKLDITQNTIKINGSPLSLDCFIGNPQSIIIFDTLLIFYDRYDGELVTIFDKKNDRCVGRFVTEGEGPNEVLPPLYMLSFPQKDKLYAFESRRRYLYSFDVSTMNVQDRVSFQESWPGIGELAKLKDYYVVKGNWQDGRRFGIYDREGNLLRTEGSYPFKEGSMEPTQRYLVYQGHTISNPNGNYFTMGCAFSDNIEFYEVRSNETVLLKRYQSYDATIESNATSMRLLDNTILSWAGGFGTAKYCYMLFLGKPFGEIRPNGSGGYKIVIFDWEGNYIKTLESAIRIRSFSVDENDSQIHAVVRNNDGEIGIMQFNINI